MKSLFFFSSRRRHTRLTCDWSSDVCSSDLALLPVSAVDPREPGRIGVELVERALAPVEPIEVTHQPLNPAVEGALAEQMPVEATVVMPLALLPDLAAHEEELLARVRPHERGERAKVGKPLPVVAGHPGEERTLAVHDLVV